MVGRHNVSNALAAFAAARALGLKPVDIQRGLNHLRTIPGRLESIPSDKGFTVFVDYAHTPDAIEQVLQSLRPLTEGKVVTVFGCGGDRDRGKRPEMGRAASSGSDHIYVTSDNPRSEDPRQIIDDILPGVSRPYTIELDRAKAINHAISNAQTNDIILIAGKGHETTQTMQGQTIEFDDRAIARAALEFNE